MFDLLRMDLHRMPRSMAFKVIAILLVFETTLTAFTFSYMLNHTSDLMEMPGGFGFEDGKFTLGMFVQMTLGQLGDFALYLAIFAVLFANGDFSTGFIKTIAGQVKSRGMLAISKFISVVIYTIGYIAFYTLIAIVDCIIFFDEVRVPDMGELIKYMLLMLYMYIAMIFLITAIALIFRSNLIGIIGGILISTGLLSAILGLVNILLDKLNIDIDLKKYTVTGSITSVTLTGDLSDYTRQIIVCAVYIVVSLIATIISYNKRDVA